MLQLEGRGWQRGCTDICYYPNSIRRKGCQISYYTLTFTVVAKYSHDTIYLAHSYPYTYRLGPPTPPPSLFISLATPHPHPPRPQ